MPSLTKVKALRAGLGGLYLLASVHGAYAQAFSRAMRLLHASALS